MSKIGIALRFIVCVIAAVTLGLLLGPPFGWFLNNVSRWVFIIWKPWMDLWV